MKIISVMVTLIALYASFNLQTNNPSFDTFWQKPAQAETIAAQPQFPRTYHENQTSICINNLTREHYQGLNVSKAETIDALSKAGFTGEQLEIMAAISRAESGSDLRCWGDEHLQNSTWRESYGLFQIRILKNPGVSCRNYDLLKDDIQAQANCAKQIYDSQGYGAWSVTHSNRGYPYKKWLNKQW